MSSWYHCVSVETHFLGLLDLWSHSVLISQLPECILGITMQNSYLHTASLARVVRNMEERAKWKLLSPLSGQDVHQKLYLMCVSVEGGGRDQHHLTGSKGFKGKHRIP